MAENFRSKQWFKNMPQERKDDICKRFDINEATLKKAGRETDDGHIVIDLLRIDHLNHYPEHWDSFHNSLKDHIDYKDKISKCSTVNELINLFESLYNIFEEHSYLKYKVSLHNDLLVKQMKNHIESDFKEYENCEDDTKAHYANRMYCHLKLLLDSDLNIVKH